MVKPSKQHGNECNKNLQESDWAGAANGIFLLQVNLFCQQLLKTNSPTPKKDFSILNTRNV